MAAATIALPARTPPTAPIRHACREPAWWLFAGLITFGLVELFVFGPGAIRRPAPLMFAALTKVYPLTFVLRRGPLRRSPADLAGHLVGVDECPGTVSVEYPDRLRSCTDLGRPSPTRPGRHLAVGHHSGARRIGRLARPAGRIFTPYASSRAHRACRVARTRCPSGSPIRRSSIAHRPTDRRHAARRLARVPRGRRRAD